MPVLPGEERAGVQPGRISIRFLTVHPLVWLATALGGTIRMKRCLISVGPGSPVLMLAHDVEIKPPEQATQLLEYRGQQYVQNIGMRLGHFRAATITAGRTAWRQAVADCDVHRGGASVLVQRDDHTPVLSLERFLITSVGHEVHTESVHDHHFYTTVVAHNVEGHYWDGKRY